MLTKGLAGVIAGIAVIAHRAIAGRLGRRARR